jgi:LacI family transcriptional regulator
MAKQQRVLCVIDPQVGPARPILLGFNAMARIRDWEIFRAPSASEVKFEHMRPHGIVLGPGVLASSIGRWDGPIAAVGSDFSARGIPSVCSDDFAVGVLAATHLMQTGAQHFAYFGEPDLSWCQLRIEGFRSELAKNHLPCSLWNEHRAYQLPERWSTQAVEVWLNSLHPPTAILAGCDRWALTLARACHEVGVRVPEDVTILGVDNDEFECAMAHLPLSSIELPWCRMGEETALLLDRTMNSECRKDERVLLPPAGIAARRSTDMVAIDDPQVAQALRMIRQHANKSLNVADILRQVPASQHHLERGFRKYVGRTMLAEIRRSHVEHAKRLLSTTVLSIDEIAQNCGFPNGTKLGIAFRRETKMTPGAYRKAFRR